MAPAAGQRGRGDATENAGPDFETAVAAASEASAGRGDAPEGREAPVALHLRFSALQSSNGQEASHGAIGRVHA